MSNWVTDSNPDKQGAYREAVLDLRVGGHDGGERLAVRLPLRSGRILGLRLRLRRFGVARVGAESRPPPQQHWAVVAPQHPRVYLFVFLPNPANCRKRNFGRNFANSERKENSNSKTKFRWIPTEISVISTEIRWFSTGKWCQLWFSYCFVGQMKNFWIPTLFSFSRSTTFVSGTFSFEQWFESYLIISKPPI